MSRRRFHRAVFALAGLYNLGWGATSAFDPQWFFRFSGLPLLNHPEVFACLGMVIGLYGFLYLRVACDPERGWSIALVGLAGKVLGPIGAATLIWQGQWPPRSILLCVTNDLIWWVPFGLYLHDSWASAVDRRQRGGAAGIAGR